MSGFFGTLLEMATRIGGKCEQVENVADLPDILLDIVSTQIDDVALTVDGSDVVDESYSPPLPFEGPGDVNATTDQQTKSWTLVSIGPVFQPLGRAPLTMKPLIWRLFQFNAARPLKLQLASTTRLAVSLTRDAQKVFLCAWLILTGWEVGALCASTTRLATKSTQVAMMKLDCAMPDQMGMETNALYASTTRLAAASTRDAQKAFLCAWLN